MTTSTACPASHATLRLDRAAFHLPGRWELVYRPPGVMAKVPIHFEFKDLPLP